MANSPTTMRNATKLDEYHRADLAWPKILAVTIVLAIILHILIYCCVCPFPALGIKIPPDDEKSLAKILFLLYMCGFLAMWLVYFSSRWESRVFRTRTLRRLLFHTSKFWSDPEVLLRERAKVTDGLLDRPDEEFPDKEIETTESNFKEKAKTSLQTLSILSAVAVFEIGQASVLRGMTSGKQTLWQEWTLDAATLFAIAAFVMFIVSIDSLDSMFNRFQGTATRHRLLAHFYSHTVNLRYFGLVFLLFGAAMVVTAQNPLLGTMSLGLIFVFGYGSWFPTIVERNASNKKLLSLENAVKVSIVGMPYCILLIFRLL